MANSSFSVLSFVIFILLKNTSFCLDALEDSNNSNDTAADNYYDYEEIFYDIPQLNLTVVDYSEPEWFFEISDTKDFCSSNPCEHNGTCEETNDGYHCNCSEPYIGKDCQMVKDYCANHPCTCGNCVITREAPYYKCLCRAEDEHEEAPRILGHGGVRRPHYPRAKDCYKGRGSSYEGRISKTENGRRCLPWNSRLLLPQSINAFMEDAESYGLGDHNYCRNPDDDLKPWCFVIHRLKVKWDYCVVPRCKTPEPSDANDCYKGRGSSYEGQISKTEIGKTCLRWNSLLLLSQSINAFMEDAKSYGLGDHNYCRNPDDDLKPWCFIISGLKVKWDYCVVPRCKKPQPSGPDVTVPKPPGKPQPEERGLTCGIPAFKKSFKRIFGGSKSTAGKHPWQASLQIKKGALLDIDGHFCGGTLIANCWVLTAGHCIFTNASKVEVVLGDQNLEKEEFHEQKFDVEKIIMHERYEEDEHEIPHNDIALLKLKQVNGSCAEETKYVKTACLPDQPSVDGTKCYISGWGATEKANYSEDLLDATVKLINQRKCNSNRMYDGVLDDGMLCAGYMHRGGIDSCQGDSGGPLMCEKGGHYYVHGVVSWGESCGVKEKPGVYTRVTKYLRWIKSYVV